MNTKEVRSGVDGLNTDRNAAFKACPESGCDWGSFYLGWKARGEVEQAIPNVPRDFKKRPVTIQAIKWTGDNLFDVIKFMSGAPSIQTDIGAAKWNEYCDLVQDNGLIIKTLEGQHIATIGDMIIRGVKGEFYPCKPDIFDMTYELSATSPAGVDWLEVVAVVKDCAHLIGDESDEISAYLPVGTKLYALPIYAREERAKGVV